jgi:hypothetical protein
LPRRQATSADWRLARRTPKRAFGGELRIPLRDMAAPRSHASPNAHATRPSTASGDPVRPSHPVTIRTIEKGGNQEFVILNKTSGDASGNEFVVSGGPGGGALTRGAARPGLLLRRDSKSPFASDVCEDD